MIRELEALVREAGELARSKTLSGQVHVKGTSDFVTDADLAVSRFLMEALVRLVPGSHVLSEEDTRADSLQGKLFIVDPIDGTTNLMYRLGLSAISCAYAEDGEVLLGVIYNPFTDELFTAERGKGACLNGQPIRVNGDRTIRDALIGMEAGPATLAQQGPFLQKIGELHMQCRGVRFTGSAAIDLAYAAAGRLTAVAFHYLYPWDFAAGWLILSEAGGRLTQLDGGEPVLSGRSRPLLASNGHVHGELTRFFGMAQSHPDEI